MDGKTDPTVLVELAGRRLRASREVLVEALRGRVTPHHRFLLKLHLGQVDALDAAIALLEKEAGECLAPFRANAQLLIGIPGVSDIVAQVS